MSEVASEITKQGLAYLSEHGSTIMVSTGVVAVLSILNAIFTRGDSQSKRVVKKNSKVPQPKWAILQVLNYVFIAVFVGSITYAVFNYRRYVAQPLNSASPLTSMFFPLMCLWSMCLAYFFGFFGISFLDTEAISESPSSFGLAELQMQAREAQNPPVKKNSNSTASATSSTTSAGSSTFPGLTNETFQGQGYPLKSKVAPRNDTPICAERPKLPLGTITEADENIAYDTLSDEEILAHLVSGTLKDYQLEKKLGDYERAVHLRRMLYEEILEQKDALAGIPYLGYDYNKVFGANCEIVVGYVPLPVGIVGPLVLNGEPVYVPMATTEGCLVASTNRGCKALTASGGCQSVLLKDAITRAPCLRMPSAMRAAALKAWVEVPSNYAVVEAAFNSTTNYGKLVSVDATVAGRNIYLRFCCMSGDAMGMNMVSKGCLKAIEALEMEFPDLVLVAISGNMCTDKKPAAINWILGRGKSVVVEAVIPEKIVKGVLKSSVYDMIETNKHKNLIGSALAGSIGGFNAHAANIVTAVFLATGQDPAQNVESSNCLTIMELAEDGKSLYVSVTMPSIEVGTVGGGTHLPAQAACLDICGVRGAAKGPNSKPGDNARKLAQIVGASVLAGELSLMAALAANHLVRSHMQHNRKPAEVPVEGAKAPEP